MTLINKLDGWSEKHDSTWFDVLRMALGIALIVKGFVFMANIPELYNTLQTDFGTASTTAAFFIVAIHLFAGLLILIGLATRFACVIQIPILFGAIIFIDLNGTPTEFISPLIVFALLLFFTVKGSGKFSTYYYISNSKRGRETRGVRSPLKGASLTAMMDKKRNLG